MAKKGSREKVRLDSTAGTGSFRVTTKAKGSEKLELSCYDKKTRQHEIFKERRGGFK